MNTNFKVKLRLSVWVLRISSQTYRHLAAYRCYQGLRSSALILFLSLPFQASLADDNCADFAGTASCATDEDPGSTSANHQPSAKIGNPINLITGNKFQSETDYIAYGSHLSLRRFYNSANAGINLGIGQGWQTSYQAVLYKISDTQLNIVQSDGRRIVFNRVNVSDRLQWVAAGSADGVIQSDGNYRYWQLSDGRTLKFKGPFLVEIKYADGQYLVLNYKSRHLHSVTDQLGRVLTFLYTEGDSDLTLYSDSIYTEVVGNLKGVRLPDGSEIYYDYDKYRNLVRVRYPDETVEIYQYLNEDFKNHVTSVNQRTGDEQTEWRYNAEGRAISSTSVRGDSIRYIHADYNQINDRQGFSDVTENGKTRRFYWSVDYETGHAKIDSIETVNCAGCEADKVTYTYADDNQLKTIQSSDGVDNVFRYDDQNRLTEELRRDRSSREIIDVTEIEYHEETDIPVRITRRSGGKISITDLSYDPAKIRPTEIRNTYINPESGGSTTQRVKGQSVNYEYKNGSLVGATVDEMEFTFGRHNMHGYPTDVEVQERTGGQSKKYAVEFDTEGIPNFSDPSETFPADVENSRRAELERYLEEKKLLRMIEELHRPRFRTYDDPLTGIPLAPHCSAHYSYRCADLERGIRYGELAGCAYVTATCPLKWDIVQPEAIGLEVNDFRHGSFRAELFYDPVWDEYVLTFVGTNDPLDWVDNVEQGLGITSSQYEDALTLAFLIKGVLSEEQVVVAGHSLGGGLATAAALALDTSAFVFNSAALTPEVAADNQLVYELASVAVTNHTVDGEILTSVQDDHLLGMHSAPGERFPLKRPDHSWLESVLGYSLLGWSDLEVSVTLHGMNAVLESLESEYHQLGCRRARELRDEN